MSFLVRFQTRNPTQGYTHLAFGEGDDPRVGKPSVGTSVPIPLSEASVFATRIGAEAALGRWLIRRGETKSGDWVYAPEVVAQPLTVVDVTIGTSHVIMTLAGDMWAVSGGGVYDTTPDLQEATDLLRARLAEALESHT